MFQLQQLAATREYWQPTEQRERERRARTAALVAAARRAERQAAPRLGGRPSFFPRLAGALRFA